MQRAGTAESAANLMPADGLADMVHHHQSGAGSIAQPQQRLAQRGHGAGIVFILIMGGIERVENNDFSLGGARGGHKMMQPLRGTEEMPGSACVYQEMLIGSGPQRAAHHGETMGKQRDG